MLGNIISSNHRIIELENVYKSKNVIISGNFVFKIINIEH